MKTLILSMKVLFVYSNEFIYIYILVMSLPVCLSVCGIKHTSRTTPWVFDILLEPSWQKKFFHEKKIPLPANLGQNWWFWEILLSKKNFLMKQKSFKIFFGVIFEPFLLHKSILGQNWRFWEILLSKNFFLMKQKSF